MADKKISALTAATTPLAGTEVLPIVQSGATVKATVANIVGAGTSPGSFTTIAGTGPVTIKQTSDYSSAGSGVNVVKSNTTDVWTSYVAADVAYSVAYGATLGASSRLLWIDTAGNANIATGNLVIGTNGKGIDFSATPGTGTSELLADYEEGDFTPTVIGLTTAGTASYSRQTGRYTKVGRLVTFQIDLDWNSGTGTGNLAFAGLPFTSSSAINTGVPANFVSNIALTALNYLQGWLPGSSTSITAMQSPVGGGAVSNVAYDAAGSVMLSGSYIV
jgi:hypothetical protein